MESGMPPRLHDVAPSAGPAMRPAAIGLDGAGW